MSESVQPADDNVFYQTARRLRALGISFVPIAPATKEPPVGFNWGEWCYRLPDASEMFEWFVVKGWHIAAVPGLVAPRFVILDFDTQGGYERFVARYPFLASCPTVKTGSGKYHIWILLPAGKTTAYYKAKVGEDTLEVRSGNHYTLCPPSTHPSGGDYRWALAPWTADGESILMVVDLEEIGLEYRTTAPQAGPFYDEGEPLTDGEVDALVEALRPDWKPGRHHDLTLGVAGWLAGYRVPATDAWTVVSILAERDGGDRGELARAVRDTFRKATDGLSVAGWARLTDRRDPLVSKATAARLDLLMRGRRPEVIFDEASPGPGAPPAIGDLDVDPEEADPANAGFPWMISVRDLLAEPDEGESWLIDGLVPARSVLWIGGPPKTFKSFIAKSLLVAAAAGVNAWGAFYTAQATPVLYVQEESSRRNVRRRFRSVMRGYGLDPDDCAARIFTITNTRFRIDQIEHLTRLVEEAIAVTGARIVCFDPLRNMHRGDENSSEDMTRLMDRMLWLRDRLGITVIIVHHFAKAGDARMGFRPDGDELRGSTALWAAGDGGLLVRPIERQDDRIQARLRLKEGRAPDTMVLRMVFGADPDDDGGSFRVDVVEAAGTGLSIDATREALEGAYIALGERRPLAWVMVEHVAKNLGMSPRTVRPKLAELEAMGLCRVIRRHKLPALYAPYGAPNPPDMKELVD